MPRYPAYMLFREQGEIIFASPKAVEQTGWVTGLAPGPTWTLTEVFRAIFPDEASLAQAQGLLERALDLVRRRGSLSFQVDLPVPDLRPGRWDIHLGLKPGASTETFLVSFQPFCPGSGKDRNRNCTQAQALRQAAAQARHILDRALAEADLPDPQAGPQPEGLGGLVALLDRARGLLGSLEA
ncbi:MAG TPA: hypothetical protein VJ623_02165 [Holophagaceae bacterium]|nr:hypothetical protein [Holophagaceae bacterium]